MGGRYFYSTRGLRAILLAIFGAILFAASFIAFAAAAAGEEEFLASLRLRGGYDSSPTLNLGGSGGSAFAGMDAAFVSARSTDEYIAGLTGETTYLHYKRAGLDPLQRHRLAFSYANKEQGGISLKSDTSVTAFRNYDTHSLDFEQRLRVRNVSAAWQPFVTAEFRYSELNEKNVIFGEFLPESYKFMRGTIIPGIAWKKDPLEIGASVNLSATRYLDELDFFGFKRDNERIQPFLFARYDSGKFNLFAAVSKLYGKWHDVDFTDMRKTLFSLTADYKHEPYAIELAAARVVTDTTFPVSPAIIDTTYSLKFSREIDAKTVAALFARHAGREFLDSPFRSKTEIAGLEITHELNDETALGLELAQVRATPISGPVVHATVGFLSVTKRTAADPQQKLRAGRAVPAR